MHDKNQYRFKAKKYGYGWTPASREGWLVVAIYAGAVSFIVYRTMEEVPDASFFKFILIATFLLLLICYKTGEPLKWSLSHRNKK